MDHNAVWQMSAPPPPPPPERNPVALWGVAVVIRTDHPYCQLEAPAASHAPYTQTVQRILRPGAFAEKLAVGLSAFPEVPPSVPL
eukprot:scaffold70385_cov23-Prasinocladus_malaysianus.AAC.1